MIVSSLFRDDVDDRTKWAQHDVYDASLSIIVHGCIRHVQAAAALLECESAAGFGADQHDKALKRRVPSGSRDRADTQPWSYFGFRLG